MTWQAKPVAVLNGLVDENSGRILVLTGVAFAAVVAPGGSKLMAGVVVAVVLTLALDPFVAADDKTQIEQIHAEYVDGEIGEAQLEQRVQLALDDRAQRIREHVEQVDDVGPVKSAAIADHFANVEALRTAAVSELTEIHGIGDGTAAKIDEQLRIIEREREQEWRRG